MRFFPFQSALKKDDSLDEKGFCAAIGVFDGIHKGPFMDAIKYTNCRTKSFFIQRIIFL